MAGHSKWANIQHRKKAQDAKRGKIFTRLIREVTIAARMGGGEVESNPRLRAAIANAKANNMALDTINRAVSRGAGDLDGDMMEEIRYEGYGPNGLAVMVDCMTDNRNRTVAEVRHAFSKRGGNLGTEGSVSYLFTKIGQMIFEPGTDEETVMEMAMESEADDCIVHEDGAIEVVTNPEDFFTIKEAFEAKGLVPALANVTMQPSTSVDLSGDEAESALALIDMLDNLDDVQDVYTNANFME